MRKIIAIAGALALTAGLAVPAVATPGEDHKDVVCHATSSLVNPYVIIVVDTASAKSAKTLKAHYKHMDDSNKKHGSDDIYIDVSPEDVSCGVLA
jgi:hypothetical protein